MKPFEVSLDPAENVGFKGGGSKARTSMEASSSSSVRNTMLCTACVPCNMTWDFAVTPIVGAAKTASRRPCRMEC